jgi:hypothetical protein
MFVIKKGSKYVSRPGSKYSYTISIEDAQKFSSKEEAERNACGNEFVISVDGEVGRY